MVWSLPRRLVIRAQAGIQRLRLDHKTGISATPGIRVNHWIPACAGMTLCIRRIFGGSSKPLRRNVVTSSIGHGIGIPCHEPNELERLLAWHRLDSLEMRSAR